MALFEGKHPLVDVDGNPFPEGSPRALVAGQPLCTGAVPYRGFTYGVLGDMDFFHKDLGMPGHNAERFCWFCKSDRKAGPNLWTDFNEDSGLPESTIIAPYVSQ